MEEFKVQLDNEAVQNSEIQSLEYHEAAEERRQLQRDQEQALIDQQEQATAEADDPRNKEGGGGLRGTVKELQSAIGGGIQDTASSLVTLPERTIDMFSGEMVEESKTDKGYDAEWDNWFVDEGNPIETRTWWGGAIRSLVHFGTLAAAIIPAAKVAGVTAATTALGSLGRGAAVGAISDVVSKYSQEDNGLAVLRDRFGMIDTPIATKDTDHPAMKTLKNVVEGMGIGAVFDGAAILIGKGRKSIKGAAKVNGKVPQLVEIKLPENLQIKRKGDQPQFLIYNKESGMPTAFAPQFEDDIGLAIWKATEGSKKARKPYRDWLKTQGISGNLQKYRKEWEAQIGEFNKDPNRIMGQDPLLSTPRELIEEGGPAEYNKALQREDNVTKQVEEKAADQMNYVEGSGGYKNKPISEPWQGSPTSTGKAADVKEQLSRTRKEAGAENGSTDSLHTPIQLERTAISAEMAEGEVARVLKDFMSDARIQAEILAAKNSGRTLAEIWGEAAEQARLIFDGRNTSDVTAEEFWQTMFEGPTVIKEGQPDQIRIWDPEKIAAADLIIGSLMKEIRDSGITARELGDIANLKSVDGPTKAMYDKVIAGLTQIKLSKMKTSGQLRAFAAGKQNLKAVHEIVDAQVQESIEAFRLALKVAGENNDDGLFKAIWETISMTNEIHNLTDFDAWMRKKLKGGEFNGKAKTGMLIKELQGVMINSVLSGPKTSVRAIMGTGSATFLRPIAQILGATISGDAVTRRASMAAMNGMVQALPEAWKLFTTKLNAYWAGDISTIKSRYSNYTKGDEQWEMFGHWIETAEGITAGDRAAYFMANQARSLNDNKFLTYSTKIMAATDDTFGYILGRAKAKEKAMREAMDLMSSGKVTEITPDLMKNAEDRFLAKILDADGNITDKATIFAKQEATLTTDLEGFSKGLNDVFEAMPWAKPFFLFARTGVNGLSLTAKHTPGFNFLVKEFNDIAFADPNNLLSVKKYGIETAEELANARALQKGRLAIGGSLILMANQHFMNGGLTGNGPADRQKRQAWLDAGYKPRTITLGGVQVGYDSFEPFNLILSTIADIGDYSNLMGEEWTEDNFQKLALVVAQGISSKSYLAGMQQFVDLFSGQPGQLERIAAGLMNNQLPMSSFRNELGKVFNPHMKELNSGIWDAIRNRNLITEGLDTEGGLPTKYDLLNGRPIKDWDFPTRMFNMFSPFSINLEQTDGRTMLFNSGYDMRMSVYSSPDDLDLSNSPLLRSLFQRAIGEYNLERKLDQLAKDPKIINSIKMMNNDLNSGKRNNNPMLAYVHNQIIHNYFEEARREAWAKVRNHPDAQKLYAEGRFLSIQNTKSLNKTDNYQNPTTEKSNLDFLLPYY